jgi:catechol 2,3-dioxygenase-like lactoylglutathione lyase family enzyme
VHVRFARHTDRLDEIVGFYRDGLGLPELGGFAGHDGYDGVFLALPGTDAHLEFTTGGAHTGPAAHPETLLVLYLGTQDAVDDALRRSGTDPVPPANPYWARNGVTIADPDGWRLVLVPTPWVP